jgi:hypothetical protein
MYANNWQNNAYNSIEGFIFTLQDLLLRSQKHCNSTIEFEDQLLFIEFAFIYIRFLLYSNNENRYEIVRK